MGCVNKNDKKLLKELPKKKKKVKKLSKKKRKNVKRPLKLLNSSQNNSKLLF